MNRLISYMHKKIKKLDKYEGGDLLLTGFILVLMIGVACHFVMLIVKV